jgi:hypothetical protein
LARKVAAGGLPVTGIAPAVGWTTPKNFSALAAEPPLVGYHLLSSVHGDLPAKLGRHADARARFEQAASLTRNNRERELLLARAAGCARRSPPDATAPGDGTSSADPAQPGAPGVDDLGQHAEGE